MQTPVTPLVPPAQTRLDEARQRLHCTIELCAMIANAGIDGYTLAAQLTRMHRDADIFASAAAEARTTTAEKRSTTV